MKNWTLVKWVFFTLLCIGITQNEATAQDNIMLGNWQNPMTGAYSPFVEPIVPPGATVVILLHPGGILNVNLSVTVAQPNVDTYPPIHIEYTFGTYSGITPPVKNSGLEPVALANGMVGYRQTFELEFNFMAECDASSTGLLEIPVYFATVTPTFNGNLIYPVTSYPDLFPYGWFVESTRPFPPPVMSANKMLSCKTAYTKTIQHVASSSTLPAGISPNPVSNELEVNYLLTQDSDVQISLIDLSGKVLYEQRHLQMPAGPQKEFMQFNQLPSGVYFVRLNTQEKNQVFKVLKN